MDKENEIIKLLKNIRIMLLIGICWLALIAAATVANAADHAIVSFNDAEHLAALQDSVVGVCDTVRTETWADRYLPDGSKVDSAHITVRSSSAVSDTIMIYFPPIVTCRQLVGVTVTEPVTVAWRLDYVATERDDLTTYIPLKSSGEAIIFYERSRR